MSTTSELMATTDSSTNAADLAERLENCGGVESVEVFEGESGVEFRRAGERTLRPYGSSTRFTFTRTSLELSGFSETESVTVYARDGAILLVSDDDVLEPNEYVEVETQGPTIPAEAGGLLDEYEASMRFSSIVTDAEGGLVFHVDVPTEFVEITDRDVRPFGDSTAFTLPPKALDEAGLAEGDDVEVSAAEGAVLMARVDT